MFQNSFLLIDRERVRNLFKQIFDGDIVNDNTNKIITKSGDSMCVDWYNEVIRDEDGEIEFLYGYGVDVTQKMAADKEIRKLSEAMQQSPDYIVITDSEGTIEYVNPAFVQNTGYSAEESIGKNPRILKSGQTPQAVYEELWGTITAGNTWKGELLNKKKNGELYWESATISPTIDQNGRIINYVAIKHDITERKAREVEIRLLNESLLKAYDATIEGWAKALELRDMETEGHSRRVVDMTIQLAHNLGINGENLMHIRRGALLHDIGKMAIPDNILQKPGPLTKEEWKIMREHPVYAWKWLSTIEHLHFSLDIPYCHH